MKLKNKKKKAFTLTELLVVVIIIGVLSAVVLPKFNKIIETRKTTEAEELMAAVRTEQEKRCAFDKPYLAEAEQLADILPSSSTKNFDYSFTNTGMIASSKGKYGYELKMPSYADGRICCENETECLKLNKDYPLCSELIAKTDYDDGTACEAAETVSGGEPTCSKISYEESCPAGQTGKIIHTVNSNCEYEVTNTCEAESGTGTCTAGAWQTATATMSEFRSLLNSDCTKTQGLSGDAAGAVNVSSVTAACTDYSAVQTLTTLAEAGSGADTCNASLDAYSCNSSSQNECIDIRTSGGTNGLTSAYAGVTCRCTVGGTSGGSSSSSGSGSGGSSSSSSSGASCTWNYRGNVANAISGATESANVSQCSGVYSNNGKEACYNYLSGKSGSTIQGGFQCLYSLSSSVDCIDDATSRAYQGRSTCGTTSGCTGCGCSGGGGWGESSGSSYGATVLKCASASRYKVTCSQKYQYRQITCN